MWRPSYLSQLDLELPPLLVCFLQVAPALRCQALRAPLPPQLVAAQVVVHEHDQHQDEDHRDHGPNRDPHLRRRRSVQMRTTGTTVQTVILT